MLAEQLHERVCVSCHTTADNIQLYCDHCGCIMSDALDTHIAAIYDYGVNAHRDTTVYWGRGFFHKKARLFLYNELDGCHAYVPLHSEPMLIGRGSASYLPSSYLDLGEFGAKQCGVARYHAQIEAKHNMLYLSDLESSTGTQLDGKPLAPHVSYTLHNWSQIVFGSLSMRIRFA
jgi:hypothetical protein